MGALAKQLRRTLSRVVLACSRLPQARFSARAQEMEEQENVEEENVLGFVQLNTEGTIYATVFT